MAFPTIASSATTATTTGIANAVNMPSGITAGDLLLVIAAHQDDYLLGVSAGWEPISGLASGANISQSVFARIAVGGDTCIVAGDVAREKAIIALRITDHGVGEVNQVIPLVTAVGLTANPNPPALDTEVEKDWLWIESFCADDDDDAASYQSTNFTQVAQVESSATATSCLAAVAYRNVMASVLNPGVMTMALAEEWVALTLAVPPAITLASAVTGMGLAGGALTTGIAITAAVSNTGVLTADLSTSILVSTVLQSDTTVQAELISAILLEASLLGEGFIAPNMIKVLFMEASLGITGFVFTTAFNHNGQAIINERLETSSISGEFVEGL